MKVLVTGAGGFLGFGIARSLVAAGDEVHSFSRADHHQLGALGITQHRGDLADAEAVAAAVEGCDLVYHVAARPGAWGPYRAYHDANVRGTEHVLAACRRHQVRDLVYTSTPSVVSRGTDLEGIDETLEYPPAFKAHYPATKAIAERLVRAENGSTLRTVSLRPHLIWGPGDPNLLPRLVQRAKAGRLRQIGGSRLIDTTFIDDAVTAHLLAGDTLRSERWRQVAGKVYFISSGTPIGNWTMIDRMLAAADLPPVKRRISPRAAYALGCAMEMVYGTLRIQSEPPLTRWVVDELSTAHWYDITAARRDLGYAPSISLEEGMHRLARWWREEGAQQHG